MALEQWASTLWILSYKRLIMHCVSFITYVWQYFTYSSYFSCLWFLHYRFSSAYCLRFLPCTYMYTWTKKKEYVNKYKFKRSLSYSARWFCYFFIHFLWRNFIMPYTVNANIDFNFILHHKINTSIFSLEVLIKKKKNIALELNIVTYVLIIWYFK